MNRILWTQPVVLNDNAAWCWFHHERALIHNNSVYLGSVASSGGADGEHRGGDIDLSVWNLADGTVQRSCIHPRFESDDHDAPGLYFRPDGRLLVVYGQHGQDNSPFQYSRISRKPDQPDNFGPIRKLDVGGGYTYQNIFRLSAESRLYNFFRFHGTERNPHYTISDDDGETWYFGGRFLNWPRPFGDPKFTGLDGGRPYVRYASNGIDSIHALVTEDHPQAYDNSLYHCMIRGGKICYSHGEAIGKLSETRETAIRPCDLAPVFAGDRENVPWCVDLRLDNSGLPYGVFSVQKHDGEHRGSTRGGEDLRYWYARYNGKNWRCSEIGFAGHRLCASEVDYSGLAALHPFNPNVLYISTSSNPETGQPLISRNDGKRHYELFRGETDDSGATWFWQPVTAHSRWDNLRPIVASGDPHRTVLLWLRGNYRSYTDYSTEAVGVIEQIR